VLALVGGVDAAETLRDRERDELLGAASFQAVP
jgi:hypothetical protein